MATPEQRSVDAPAATPAARAAFAAARGELGHASGLAREVLARPDVTPSAASAARVALSIVAREKNRLSDARSHVEAAIVAAEGADLPAMVALARLEQAMVASSHGAHLEAIGLVVDVDRHVVPSESDPRLRGVVDAVDALVHLAGGDVDRAEVLTDLLPERVIRSLLGARIALARGRSEVALAGAERVLGRDRLDLRRRLEALVLAGRAAAELGAHESARRRLGEAAARAAPDGHVRVYIDLGVDPPGSEPADLHQPVAIATPAWLVLSTREQQVLRLLRRRLDNREIGDAMYISVNTVKTHLKNIYRKLGVASRREAVERATALGLL